MKPPYISVVIPLFNEQESLRELVRGIDDALKGEEYEYIFVDDGSTDGSYEELLDIKKSHTAAITIIRFRKNSGKSLAMSAGFSVAKGKRVVTLDADLQDEPGEIPKLLQALDDGLDLVIGWRSQRQDASGKIRLSHIFNGVVSRVAGVRLHDMNSGLKAMRVEVAREIELYGELHRFIPVLAANRGFRVGEVPVKHHERKYGESKFGRKRIVHAAFDLMTTMFLTSFRHKPLQVFGPVGIVLVMSGILPLLYLTYLRFIGETIGDRPLLLFGVLLVLFGVQIVSVGLLGELITSTQVSRHKFPIKTSDE